MTTGRTKDSHQVILKRVIINPLNTYNDQYIDHIQKEIHSTFETLAAKWLIAQHIKIHRVSIPHDDDTISVVIYVSLTETQATEYYLRF